MASQKEMEFPTEWVIYEADDDKRGYEEKPSEKSAREAAADRAEPASATHVDTVRTEGTRRADLKVMRAAG